MLAPRTILRRRLIAQAAAATLFGVSLFAFEPMRSANQPRAQRRRAHRVPDGIRDRMHVQRDHARAAARRRSRASSTGNRISPLARRRSARSSGCGGSISRGSGSAIRTGAQSRRADRARDARARARASSERALSAQSTAPDSLFSRRSSSTLTVALIFYLNFKYGYTQSPELGAACRAKCAIATISSSGASPASASGCGLGLAQCWRTAAATSNAPTRSGSRCRCSRSR